jgi:hypothetical protein
MNSLMYGCVWSINEMQGIKSVFSRPALHVSQG